MPLDAVSLKVVVATGPLLEQWRAIHNAIIPTAPLTSDEVAERSGRHRLTLGYVDVELPTRGARRIVTVVLASNTDGLAFAPRGFVEHDLYLLDGDTIPFVDLHLPA